MRFILTLLAAAACLAFPAHAQTVVLVRHAEKVAPTGDVDLSATGQARAQLLAQALAGAKVTLILATPFKRTGQTAQPTAQAAKVQVTLVSFDGGDAAHIQRVAAQARKASPKTTVLIVGHSNTIAEIARALGDPAPPKLTDCEYDQMTVLELGRKTTKAVHTRYGAPTPSC